MAKGTDVARAPRGTKILVKAFFDAADEIPEPNRGAVVKAALGVVRDELKADREKAAVAKAKAKGAASKAAPAKPAGKLASRAASTTKPKKSASAPVKAKAKKATPKKGAAKDKAIEMPTLDAVADAQK